MSMRLTAACRRRRMSQREGDLQVEQQHLVVANGHAANDRVVAGRTGQKKVVALVTPLAGWSR